MMPDKNRQNKLDLNNKNEQQNKYVFSSFFKKKGDEFSDWLLRPYSLI